MESFHCKMMQTYRCYHNSYTPDVQVDIAWSETLYLSNGYSIVKVS